MKPEVQVNRKVVIELTKENETNELSSGDKETNPGAENKQKSSAVQCSQPHQKSEILSSRTIKPSPTEDMQNSKAVEAMENMESTEQSQGYEDVNNNPPDLLKSLNADLRGLAFLDDQAMKCPGRAT